MVIVSRFLCIGLVMTSSFFFPYIEVDNKMDIEIPEASNLDIIRAGTLPDEQELAGKSSFSISGLVENLPYGVYLKDVKCEAISEDFITADITNLAGEYKVVNLPAGGDYRLAFEKIDGDPVCGISDVDMTLILRHIRGKQLFTAPWQYLAADVSGDQHITLLDIIRIRTLLEQGLPLPNPWTFMRFTRYGNIGIPPWPINGSLVFPNLSEDQVHKWVIAIKGGDVDGRGCLTPGE